LSVEVFASKRVGIDYLQPNFQELTVGDPAVLLFLDLLQLHLGQQLVQIDRRRLHAWLLVGGDVEWEAALLADGG
jgi:hypothetical protein